MNSQSILVLGAGGFVGGHLIKNLTRVKGLTINAIGQNTKQLPFFPSVDYHQSSLDNVKLLNRLLPECSHIFHLASASTPGSSALNPVFESDFNISPTLRFLEALQNYPSVRLIFLSSGGAIYGNVNPDTSFIQENTPPAPLSYYGAGKVALENFIIALCNQQKRPGIILRPANFYGPEQGYREGFGIIPTIFHHIIEKKPLEVWGNGENVRDYIFIQDFIELCMKFIKSSYDFNHAKIYNVGSQEGITLNALCSMIEQVVGVQIERKYNASRNVDVNRVVLNCNQIRDDYNWKARTSLLTGLKKTWSWFLKKES